MSPNMGNYVTRIADGLLAEKLSYMGAVLVRGVYAEGFAKG